jgi:formylmethanofuran dehydrogenase subunit D
MKAILVTGTSMDQERGKEHGKLSSQYKNACATLSMTEEDMQTLGVEPSQTVKVTSPHGSVILTVVKAKEANIGIVFIPSGPWANQVTDPHTGGTGMPHFKGLEVEVQAAPEEKVLDLKELIEVSYGRKKS